jgi:type IV secretory pathway VirB2 component (pilin)
VDRVNVQLDKVDQMTDSAVDAVASVDTAVRTVSHVVTGPVGKLAGLAAGIRHGVSTLTTRRSFGDAVRTGKEEAARRERDLEEELDEDK